MHGAVQPPASAEARVLARSMLESLVRLETDDAERLYTRLCEVEPRASELKIYPTLIAIQRGQVLDAYRELHEGGEDHHPELQALCLHRLCDPTWEGVAQRTEASSADPQVRRAMRELLGRPEPLE